MNHEQGLKKIHKKWKEHIVSFIEKKKGQVVSIRDLMNSYDKFWNNNENTNESLKILQKQQEKAIEELNKYTPKRFSARKNKKTSSINSLFRGDSYLLSACVVDDSGQPIGQLYDESLLNESRNWFINKMKTSLQVCLKTKIRCEKANKINGYKFEYNKYIKNFGFKAERPLLCSHINEEIDQSLFKSLCDEDNNSTNHRVYHKKFGLVKKDLIG